MAFIDIKNLVFEYFRRDDEGNVEEMVEALSDISIEIEQGDFIAIVGKNGSGKSTLAKQINALLTPSEGAVIVDGMDTENEELRLSIRKTAGMVFQNPDNQIIGSMVEEDVAFGPENLGFSKEKIWNQVDSALNMAEIQGYRKNNPNNLSGGQKQRVAIAGVLAMEPKCIIFDESTAMLDPGSRKRILKTAKLLNREKGITIIWITHHMNEVIAADKVFVMKQGKLVLQGTPKQIFEEENVIYDCGLMLPVLYQYIKFLTGQGLLSKEEAFNVESDEDLVDLLCNKYAINISKTKNVRDDKSDNIDKDDEMNSIIQHRDYNPAEGLLLDNVSYIYNKGFAGEIKALKNVNLHIGSGEFVAVIGNTGSGKSTLMQHLNGLLVPDEGNVYYNGKDIADKDFSLKKLRQKVGLVFQYPEYQLFAETVEQDVAFGPLNMDISKVEANKRAYSAIEAVGLPDTIYDAAPLSLSGGQKRRVAIAGVLAMGPEYLVLDEPTAGLDPVSAKELLDMLKHLQTEQGITIVMVSHSMEEVSEYADRIVFLRHGELIIDGESSYVYSSDLLPESYYSNLPLGVKILRGLKESGVAVDISKHKKEDVFMELCGLKEF